MQWIRFRIRTIPEAEDLIVSEICALGLEGAQIEDKVPLTAAEKEQIYTYDADDPVDDGIAHVSFYAQLSGDGRVALADETPETIDALRARMENALAGLKRFTAIGDGVLSVEIMDDALWRDKWKQFFHSFYIDDLFITPSWETDLPTGAAHKERAEKQARYMLQIDPGTAFGTGAHETTQLAIRALRKAIETFCAQKNDAPRVLDVGTGSGILAILSLMFGAKEAIGVDVDAFAKEVALQNAKKNHIDPARLQIAIGDVVDDQTFRQEILKDGAFDVVVANILPVVLRPLTAVAPAFLNPDAVYITSGILAEKEAEMRRALEGNGFDVQCVAAQGEWRSLVSRRRNA